MATHDVYDSNGNLIHSEEIPDPVILLTPDEFFEKFTIAEAVAINSSTDPGAIYVRSQLYARTAGIDLKSPIVQQALGLFVSLSILTPERATELGWSGGQ